MRRLSCNHLVAAWRAGDENAQTELRIRHFTVLVSSIRRRVGCSETAERIADAAYDHAREHFNPTTENFFCHLLGAAQTLSDDSVPAIIKLAGKYLVPGYDTRDASSRAYLRAKSLEVPQGKVDAEHPLRELLAAIDASDDPGELRLVARYLMA